MKLAFIGYGNMAQAIVAGLDAKHFEICCASPSLQPGQQGDLHYFHNNLDAINDADAVILAVKPQKLADVLKEIAPHIPKNAVLISIAAGISLARLKQLSRPAQAIVRCMPNTPLAVGKGATPLTANAEASPAQKALAERIFKQSGITCWTDNETLLDSFTALSGSGPAYVYLFAQSMMEAAEALGIDKINAKAFAVQTIAGAAEMMKQSALSPEQLRQNVTSPAGTTAAATDILQQQHFSEIIHKAMQAAFDRAQALGKMN